MAIHIDIAENSYAETNALTAIELISPEQLLQNIQNPLISLPDAVRYNQNPLISFPDTVTYKLNRLAFVTDNYPNCHQIAALTERLRAENNRVSVILEATFGSGGEKDVLKARMLFLTEEMQELERASEQQSQRKATLQFDDNDLAVKLNHLNVWKTVSVIFFTLAAAISAAVAVIAVNVDPKKIVAAAVATAATVLIGALGNGIHSRLQKRESSVKKNRDILRAELMCSKIITDNLTEVFLMARDLQSDTKSILADDGATDVAVTVREKVSALNESFGKFQRKARSCSYDVSS